MRSPTVHSERDYGHFGACRFSFRMFTYKLRRGQYSGFTFTSKHPTAVKLHLHG